MTEGRKVIDITSLTLVNNTAKTIDITCGANNRWILKSILQKNCDDIQRNCYVTHKTAAGITIVFLIQGNALVALAEQNWPSLALVDLTEVGNPGFDYILEATEFIRLAWDAGGASTGATDADGVIVQVMEMDI